MSSFKIYYNDSFLLLTKVRPQSNKKFAKVVEGDIGATGFFKDSSQLFDGKTNGNILIVCDNTEMVMSFFLRSVQLVIAGGGIVRNEKDNLLMIYRRGKWDLPKGKIDKGENILDGAIREVEEETGVKVETVDKHSILTYHAYKLKGTNSLKETSWFEMKAKPGQTKPVPQAEEDIDEVRWVKKSDLKKYKAGCYLLIWDLILPYSV